MIFELVSNTLSAMTLGFTSGILVSVLAIAQFHVTVELPCSIQLPTVTLAIVFGCSILSLVAGARYGTQALYNKNIASILKGQ